MKFMIILAAMVGWELPNRGISLIRASTGDVKSGEGYVVGENGSRGLLLEMGVYCGVIKMVLGAR